MSIVRSTLCALVVLATSGAAAAQEPTPADRAAAIGRHEEAARELESELSASGWSAPLLVDLGNAEYRQGMVGQAILAWERARILSPDDDAVLTNLDRARTEHALAPPEESGLERASRVLPVRTWLHLGLASLGVFVLATVALSFTRRRAVLSATAAIATMIVTTSAGALWLGTLSVTRGVVVADGGVVARLSPFEDADPIATLPEGEVVVVDGRHEGWARLETRDGASAWAPLGAIEPIVENVSAL